jgi:phosphatidylserine/phosphatidylglycerophosphate/cardiolipin synthase-like enzyme
MSTTESPRPITTPLALNRTKSAKLTFPWFVQDGEYKPAQATYMPLVNGKETFAAVFDAILKAEHSIDILCWGFQPSMYFKRGTQASSALKIGELLERKGQQGVKIRLLVWGDSLHVSAMSEDSMPGNHGAWGTATAAKDGRSSFQRDFDTLWYKRANMNNVTRRSGQTNPFVAAKYLATDAINAMPFGDQPLTNIEFATRDFDLKERAEIAWRISMTSPGSGRKVTKWSTAAMTAEPSHHQKAVLVDYEVPEQAVGFVMGHNTLDEYWDRDDHSYMREHPSMGRNGLHPRQDMSSQVTGPILEFLNRNFCEAWDKATGQQLNSARAGLYPRLKLRPEFGTPVMAQILRTQSQTSKRGTQDIQAVHFQAVNNTTRFVYIENQYFRYTPIARKLKDAINAQTKGGRDPGKHGQVYLFVITNSNDDGIGLGTVSTYQMLDALGQADKIPGVAALEREDVRQKKIDDQIAGIDGEQARLQADMSEKARALGQPGGFASGAYDRYSEDKVKVDQLQHERAALEAQRRKKPEYTAAQLARDVDGLNAHICTLVPPDMPAGREWDYVYIHQKLMIVDDAFMTQGSANINKRSMEVDSELNICLTDSSIAAALRKRLWGLHTKNRGAQNDIAQAFSSWDDIISQNATNQGKKLPPIASLVGFMRTSPKRSYFD